MGISSESIYNYIEQMSCDGDTGIMISKKVCNMLTEDINYKLHHILQVSALISRIIFVFNIHLYTFRIPYLRQGYQERI